MLCTASVLIQGKLKRFIASMKDITVLGAMGHPANTSRITFSAAISFCVRITALPLLEQYGNVFGDVLLGHFIFEK